MYIYTHINTHTYIIHILIHTYINIYIHTYINTHACIHTRTYIHTYMHTHIHINTYTYIHTHIYIHTYIHTHTYIYTYIRTYIHACIHTYTHTYIRTNIHTYTHTHIHIYVQTYIYIYTYTYIHTYIHAYIHTHTHIFMVMGVSPVSPVSPVSMHRASFDTMRYAIKIEATQFYELTRGSKKEEVKYWHDPAERITFLTENIEKTNTIQIFTDGSKSEQGVGAGIAIAIHRSGNHIKSLKCKLNKRCTNNRAEQLATLRAVEYTENIATEDRTATIYTGSRITLGLLENSNNHTFLIEEIRSKLTEMRKIDSS